MYYALITSKYYFFLFFAVPTFFFFKLSMIFFVSSLGTHNFNKTQFMSSNIFSIPEYLCNTQHIDQKEIKLQTKSCDHRIAQARKKVHKSDITVVTSSDLDPVSLTREGPAWGILTVVTSSDLDPVSRTPEEPAWGDLTLFLLWTLIQSL